MARPDKASAVAELTAEFRDSSAAMLTEYRGLTVAQLKDLRRALGEHASYAVVKNTLTKIAAREAGIATFENLLEGPSAIAFVRGDPVEAARGLRDFSRTHPLLVIKGGVMEGKPLSADEIRTLADLEPREVLLAKLAGAMKASLSGAVALFAAPLSQTARLLEALRQQAESDPSVLRGGPAEASGPASEPVAAEQPARDDSSTTPETAADTVTDAAADDVTEASTDTATDTVTDAAADDVTDTATDTATDAAADEPAERAPVAPS